MDTVVDVGSQGGGPVSPNGFLYSRAWTLAHCSALCGALNPAIAVHNQRPAEWAVLSTADSERRSWAAPYQRVESRGHMGLHVQAPFRVQCSIWRMAFTCSGGTDT